LQDKIYFLFGQIIARNLKTAPILFFDLQINFLIADSEGYTNSLANKSSCWGFGIVINKEEISVTGPGVNAYKNLMATMKHSDYNNNVSISFVVCSQILLMLLALYVKDVVDFTVRYTIAGNCNLAKTFGLFQLGRKVVIAGFISRYDIKTYVMKVTVSLPCQETNFPLEFMIALHIQAVSVSVSSGSK
jgi:hypothetical protein